MSAVRLHLQLLGPFRLHQGDQPVAGFDQARLQHLLAYLVSHRAAPVSRQQLAFSFWPDTTDQQALKNLRALLTRLRHALPIADHFFYPEGDGGAMAYGPVVEWLRDAALEPSLKVLDDVWLVEVARILPGLLADRPHLMSPSPLIEAWQRTRLFEALARAVLGEVHTPLLLFPDDLQWCDQETAILWPRLSRSPAVRRDHQHSENRAGGGG
jgi:hypothetical protein